MSALPQLNRAQLSKIFGGDEAVIRAYEALQSGMQFAPDQIQQALEDAAAAQLAADGAQLAADAAGVLAASAQADATALKAVPYVTITNDPTVSNERALGIGQGLSMVDAGAGLSVTLSTSDIISVLPADVADTTAAFVNATGLVLALPAGATYLVDALLTFQSAAVTTGIALTFTLPAGAVISGMYQHNTTATAREGSYNIAAGAVKGNTSAVLVATENIPLQGRWVIKTDVTPGNAQLQFRTEVAASAVTLKAGLCVLIARRIA